jgi:hypothetical protein
LLLLMSLPRTAGRYLTSMGMGRRGRDAEGYLKESQDGRRSGDQRLGPLLQVNDEV